MNRARPSPEELFKGHDGLEKLPGGTIWGMEIHLVTSRLELVYRNVTKAGKAM